MSYLLLGMAFCFEHNVFVGAGFPSPNRTAGRGTRPLRWKGKMIMETRVAVLGIIVEDTNSTEELNSLLHDYGQYIIGRMGIPYREKNINIISIAIDAPQDTISTLTGKIGKINGVSVKTAYSNVVSHE